VAWARLVLGRMADKGEHHDHGFSCCGIERRGELDRCGKDLFDLIVKDKWALGYRTFIPNGVLYDLGRKGIFAWQSP